MINNENIMNKEENVRFQKPRRIVYYVLGVLETLFAFRLILKLMGASTKSLFVSIIYDITHVLLYPFVAIFRSASTTGIETRAVLEPSTIIGMIVYALVALGIVKLIYISRNAKRT